MQNPFVGAIMFRASRRFTWLPQVRRWIAYQNVIRVKNYSAQFKSSVGFKRWANGCSWWSFLDLARILHICNVSRYSGKWNCHHCCRYTAKNHGCWLCIYWSGVVFLSWQFKIYCSKITFFFCSRFSFHVWSFAAHKDVWTGKRPHIHTYLFRGLIIIITFCCLPTLPRIIPRQVFKYKNKFRVIYWAADLVVSRENYTNGKCGESPSTSDWLTPDVWASIRTLKSRCTTPKRQQ